MRAEIQRLRDFWRGQGKLGKTLVVVVVALVALGIVGAIAGGSDDGGNGDTNVVTETSETTETTEPTTVIDETTEIEAASSDPMSCLEDAELSNVEERDSNLWRATHDNPFYGVIIDRLASPADARRAVRDATAVYAAQAGRYAVTGPLKATAEGSLLTADEGAEAQTLVQSVATCLGG